MGGHEAVGFYPVCYQKAISMRKGKSIKWTKKPWQEWSIQNEMG